MEKIKFKTTINATKEKVWEVLFGVETYPKWTAVFAEGSQVETDWKKGSRAIFGDGKGNGMLAVIHENIPHQYLSIKHIGEIKDGKETLHNWGESFENYTLNEKDSITELLIDMDIVKEWVEYFQETWPKALAKVKEIAEKG
ncbi:Activator of Hsp90 ATPase homolog 1-like protein [Pedobacter terrae]|uniref:Activator of Hsp90 ATPase homolog 1-like protein n=1 Tax=Pedobacter terrae TaxID=405671 RepID=A0A1G7TSM6_9SPHI|nr:SRPBCC domain-containing protein [Pedobacter terrae]SDG38192.1 Activator of Hsp90 ATPase homolog 1-like protein [Pedobacter terrae]